MDCKAVALGVTALFYVNLYKKSLMSFSNPLDICIKLLYIYIYTVDIHGGEVKVC